MIEWFNRRRSGRLRTGKALAALPPLRTDRPAPAARAFRNDDLQPVARGIGAAEETALEVAGAMMGEVALRHPGGDVQALALVAAKCAHPTGAAPYAVYTVHADNLDTMMADTMLFGAVIDWIVSLELPPAIAKELARRIQARERFPVGVRHG